MTDTPAPLPKGSAAMSGPILVGVMPGQHPAVVQQAALLASSAGLPLVCAHADVTVYPVDGTTGGPSAPIDPDGSADDIPGVDDSLRAAVATQLASVEVDWSIVALAGEPARALAREADIIGASMIVVGTREHKLTAAIKELTAGSVARHLFHRQDRPVLVVPVNPRIPTDDDDD